MATKEQNLKRLDELALILGREPDISGSAAEIAQRVAEWAVSYTHLTLPTTCRGCRSRWSPYH